MRGSQRLTTRLSKLAGLVLARGARIRTVDLSANLRPLAEIEQKILLNNFGYGFHVRIQTRGKNEGALQTVIRSD